VELKGTVAIVTGAARGIGRGIADCLAREGVHVVIADLGQNQDIAREMEETARQVRAHGVEALTVNVDVRDWEQVQGMVKAAIDHFGRVDILVNNAGIIRDGFLAKLSDADWDQVLAVNLKGPFLCCQAALPLLRERERSCIVNIASRAWLGNIGQANYAASKGGVVSLTRTLALELAAYGIRVNAVCPGPVYTEFNKTVMAQRCQTLGITEEQMVERIRASIPLGRWGEPEDIARAVAFLCSPNAGWITGEVLRVSGGLEGVAAAPPKRAKG